MSLLVHLTHPFARQRLPTVPPPSPAPVVVSTVCRYRYANIPGLAAELRRIMDGNARDPLTQEAAQLSSTKEVRLPRPFKGDPAVDDAFATIMQWLYSRIPHTR